MGLALVIRLLLTAPEEAPTLPAEECSVAD